MEAAIGCQLTSTPILRNLPFPPEAAARPDPDLIPRPEAPKAYSRVTLHHDEQIEVVAARWIAGGQSSLHSHGPSAAIYTVLSGVVEEEHYLPEGESFRFESRVLRAGDKVYVPPGCYHQVRALEESVTLHTYSPAPVDAVAPAPPETLVKLEEAKRRAEKPVPARAPRPRPIYPDLRAVVQDFLEGWAEREAEANLEGLLSLPPRTVAEFKDSGILAAPIPHEYGGWGTSLAETVAAIRLVAQRAPATALALVMPLGNAATTRIPEAVIPPHLRSQLAAGKSWISAQVRRGRILAVANSEPGAGGDLKNTKTMAQPSTDGSYRLTGRKSFATFGRDADYFLCAARRIDIGQGEERSTVDGFFVARDATRLVIDDRWNPVGMRPTASVGLTLDDTPAEAMLGYPGCLEGVNARHWSTVLFAAVFLGVGEGALREGARHVAPGSVWARATLAECALSLDAAAGFVEAVAGQECWPLPAALQERMRRAKTFVARAAVETATRAAMLSGGRSYTPDHPVFRFLCDALAGPLLRPPLPQAMDDVVGQLFPSRPDRAAA